MGALRWRAGGLDLRFDWDDDHPVTLARWSEGGVRVRFPRRTPLVEILADGYGHLLASGRLANTLIGSRMRYMSHNEPDSSTLNIIQYDPVSGLETMTVLHAVGGTGVIRSHTTVTNRSDRSVTVRSVSSWAQTFGVPSIMEDMDGDYPSWTLTQGRSDWMKENRWTTTPVMDCCPPEAGHPSRSGYETVSHGSFSTGQHQPFLILASPRLALAWGCQIEHNGPWRWEIGNDGTDGDLTLSGPEDMDHDWHATLAANESFDTVSTAVTLSSNTDGVLDQMTSYRRAMSEPYGGTGPIEIVFNDYMNTLNGDPTASRLIPLIDAAAEAGADVFCIDAGWYADQGDWWTQVGAWEPSRYRFPSGMREVTDRIRAHGMRVGLWLEPEVIGVDSPIARTLPDEAFMTVRGARLTEQGRYLLDLTNPAARNHVDETVERLIAGYNVGYLKFDYNVDAGPGTDRDGCSRGMGLLDHARAYQMWLADLRRRHPRLVIENCASGGMRADPASLALTNLQSTSDQTDWRRYPPIASGAGMTIPPEQAANWAYPQPGMSDEEIIFTLIVGMAGRMYLSGHIDRMNEHQQGLVAQAVDAYDNGIRPYLNALTPYWPTGLHQWDDTVVSYGLRPPKGREGVTFIYLWVRGTAGSGAPITLHAEHLKGRNAIPEPVYPTSVDSWNPIWNPDRGTLSIRPVEKGVESAIIRINAI